MNMNKHIALTLNCQVSLLNMSGARTRASYRHILRIQIVESVHVAVDMKQVTLHRTHTYTHTFIHRHMHAHKHSSVYALQVCCWKILISHVHPSCSVCMLSHLS